MKKIFSFVAVALMSVSMFAYNGTIPTDADLDFEEGKLTIAIKFDHVRGDVYFVGTYNNWGRGEGNIESFDNCQAFKAVEGFDGWYQILIEDESASIEGKPVHTAPDGVWSWDYQTGDADSWELIRGTVNITAGYAGESDLKGYDKSSPVVLVSNAWKNDPCSIVSNYHIVVDAPLCGGFAPMLVGGFDGWNGTPMVADEANFNYYLDIKAAQGSEYKIVAVPLEGEYIWDNELLYYDSSTDTWNTFYNHALPNGTDDPIVINLDYSDETKYRWAKCAKVGDQFIIDGVTYMISSIGSNNTVKVYWYDSNYSNSPVIPASVSYKDYTFVVTEIYGWSFANNANITSIVLPNTLVTIEGGAFYGCTSLTSVTIPNSVKTIGENAFAFVNNIVYNGTATGSPWGAKCVNGYVDGYLVYSDTSKTTLCGCSTAATGEIVIPHSVTTIGNSAFSSCKGLTLMTCKATTPPACGLWCFDGIHKYIPIYVPARSIGNYKQVEGWKDFANIQGNPSDYSMVSVIAENGTISGAEKYIKGDTCTLTATADYGYHFMQWSDGNTDNPRKIIVTQDTTFIAEFTKNIYTISVEAEHGSITGGGEYEYLSSVQLTATADEHYHFVQWGDWNTNNPRKITVDRDKTYTAIFSIDQHTISAYAEHGSVNGTGIYDYGIEATLTVIPYIGYEFATWSDGNTDNPRTILVTEDATYYSTCTLSTKGTCGDNLYWEYKDGSLIINGQGAMYNFAFNQVPWILYHDSIQQVELCEGLTNVGNNAFASCSKLTSMNIPNSVTTIGESAFENCTYLKTITLGKSLTDIGCNAFKGDFRIEEITSYAEVTPNVCSSTFDGLSKQYIYLYVPENSIRGYQVDPNWNGFDIRTKSAEVTPMDDGNPIVTPSDQDVTITWPITDGTDTYTLTITKNGEVVCVLTFNGNGQLTNIAFAAPGHNGAHQAPAATLTAQGYQFTVMGLNPGTAYNYSVTATDAGGKTLAEHKGNFSTTGGESSLESVHGSQCTMHKVLRNGQILLERNNATYTLMGQKVR